MLISCLYDLSLCGVAVDWFGGCEFWRMGDVHRRSLRLQLKQLLLQLRDLLLLSFGKGSGPRKGVDGLVDDDGAVCVDGEWGAEDGGDDGVEVEEVSVGD